MAFDCDVIIGSGFGASVLAIDQSNKGKYIMILERGVWWSTPELSAENPLAVYLKTRPKTQPVQHPLGGCPIGGSSSDGVMNGHGQVYDTQAGAQSVHAGLYVADGSTVPGALAVNPTLTIVSQALRVAASIP